VSKIRIIGGDWFGAAALAAKNADPTCGCYWNVYIRHLRNVNIAAESV